MTSLPLELVLVGLGAEPIIVGPTSTIQANQWRSSIDNSTNLHIPLADDTTDNWARSGANPESDVSIAGFDPLNDPGVDEGHFIRYRFSKDVSDGRDIDLTARISAAGTTVKEQFHQNISDEIIEATLELNEAETQLFRSLGGYSDLRVEFMSDHTGGGPSRRARVYHLQFQLPALVIDDENGNGDPEPPPPSPGSTRSRITGPEERFTRPDVIT